MDSATAPAVRQGADRRGPRVARCRVRTRPIQEALVNVVVQTLRP